MPLDVMQLRQGAGFEEGGGWLGASNPGVLRLPCLVPPHNPKRSVPEPTRGLAGLEDQRYPHGHGSKRTMGQHCMPPTKVQRALRVGEISPRAASHGHAYITSAS